MKIIGPGVKELCIHKDGEHRVVSVAKFDEAVYVLHAFQQKTQKTTRMDLDLARNRYQALINERMQR